MTSEISFILSVKRNYCGALCMKISSNHMMVSLAYLNLHDRGVYLKFLFDPSQTTFSVIWSGLKFSRDRSMLPRVMKSIAESHGCARNKINGHDDEGIAVELHASTKSQAIADR